MMSKSALRALRTIPLSLSIAGSILVFSEGSALAGRDSPQGRDPQLARCDCGYWLNGDSNKRCVKDTPPHANAAALAAERLASCVRMHMADYCGDTGSWTLNGTWIRYDETDLAHALTDLTEAPFFFEAGWNQDGPICLSHYRWATVTPFGGTLCGGLHRIDPRDPQNAASAGFCEDAQKALPACPAAPREGRHLFNASAGLDRGLYTWLDVGKPVDHRRPECLHEDNPADECRGSLCDGKINDAYTTGRFSYGEGYCLQDMDPAAARASNCSRGLAKAPKLEAYRLRNFEGALFNPNVPPELVPSNPGELPGELVDLYSYPVDAGQVTSNHASLVKHIKVVPPSTYREGKIFARATKCSRLPAVEDEQGKFGKWTSAVPLYLFRHPQTNDYLTTTDVAFACSRGYTPLDKEGYIPVRFGAALPSQIGQDISRVTFASAGCNNLDDASIALEVKNLCANPRAVLAPEQRSRIGIWPWVLLAVATLGFCGWLFTRRRAV